MGTAPSFWENHNQRKTTLQPKNNGKVTAPVGRITFLLVHHGNITSLYNLIQHPTQQQPTGQKHRSSLTKNTT